jgi:hypothetical protein
MENLHERELAREKYLQGRKNGRESQPKGYKENLWELDDQ